MSWFWKIEGALCEAAWLTLLLGLPILMGGFRDYAYKPALAIILVATAATLVRSRLLGSGFPLATRVDALLAGLLIWSALSTIASANREIAGEGFSYLLFGALFHWNLRTRYPGPPQIRRALWGLVLVATAICVYGIQQTHGGGGEHVLWISKRAYLGQVTGTFVNHSHFASFQMIGLGAALALAWRSGIMVRILLLGSAAILMAGIALSESRGAWFAWPAGAALALGLSLRSSHLKSRPLIGGLVALLLCVGLTTPLLYRHVPRLRERIDSLTQGSSLLAHNSAGERLLTWRSTLRMIGDHPILGVGPGMWYSEVFKYRHRGQFDNPTEAHNEWLQVAAEGGIPAFLATLILVMFWMASCLRRGLSDSWAAGSLYGVLPVMLHACLEFGLHSPALYIGTLFLMTIGLETPRFGKERAMVPPLPGKLPSLDHLDRDSVGTSPELHDSTIEHLNNSPRRTSGGPPPAVLVTVVMASLVGVWVMVHEGLADMACLRGQMKEEPANIADSLFEYEKALKWAPWYLTAIERATRARGLAAQQLEMVGIQDRAREMTRNQRSALSTLVARRPAEPRLWKYRAALLEQLLKIYPEESASIGRDIEESYAGLTRSDPHHWYVYALDGDHLLRKGQLKGALDQYRRALELYPMEHIGIYPEVLHNLQGWRVASQVADPRALPDEYLRLALEILRIRTNLAFPRDHLPAAHLEGMIRKYGSRADSEWSRLTTEGELIEHD